MLTDSEEKSLEFLTSHNLGDKQGSNSEHKCLAKLLKDFCDAPLIFYSFFRVQPRGY